MKWRTRRKEWTIVITAPPDPPVRPPAALTEGAEKPAEDAKPQDEALPKDDEEAWSRTP